MSHDFNTLSNGTAGGEAVIPNEEHQPPLPTCILGMHRSGTSFVSRLVNLLAVDLGPDPALLKTSADNPTGFWEHSGIVGINDEILERFGGRWDKVPAWPEAWVHDPRLDDLREKAHRLMAEDFSPHRRWGWKDPRNCLTLPFWREVVGRMDHVLVFRNPCAVISSLSRRNGMAHEQAESLWIDHVSASLWHTAHERRLIVFYDNLLCDTPRELQRLAAFLGVPARTADPLVLAAVAEFVEPDLCHHRMSLEDAATDVRLSFVTKALYLAVRGHTPLSADHVAPLTAHSRRRHHALDALAASAPDAWRRSTSVETLARESQVWHTTIAALTAEGQRLREQAVSLETEKACLIAAHDEQRNARAAAELARDQEAHARAAAELARDQEAHARAAAELARDQEAQARAAAHQLRDTEAAARAAAERLRDAQASACAAAERRRDAADHARRTMEHDLDTARERLTAIEASTAWRLVAAFRRALIRVAPGGTRRRRAWNGALRWMGGTPVDPDALDGAIRRR